MTSPQPVLNTRRLCALGTSLAGLALVIGLGAAVARNDDGSKTFFLENGPTFSFFDDAPQPQHSFSLRETRRVLTVGLRRRFRAVAGLAPTKVAVRKAVARKPRVALARRLIAPVTGRVTIYTDATLQRGDAVMTDNGIRIFNGAEAFPHRAIDFVAVKHGDGLSRAVTRTLLAMDSVPPV